MMAYAYSLMLERNIYMHIKHESDVIIATMRTIKECKKLGMSATDYTLCATAVSELATNISRYADKGSIVLHTDADYLHITAKDLGPGIDDINLAMQEGHSSSSGLGMGLSGVARMMDSFHIESHLNKGTCVQVSKCYRKRPTVALRSQFTESKGVDIGSYSEPHPYCIVNGDGSLHIDMPPYRYIALWDVSGHGDEAYALSQQVDVFLRQNLPQLPNQLIKQLHQKFQGSCGLVAIIARLNTDSGMLDYSGVGNISLLQIGGDGSPPHRLALQNGVIGNQIRTPINQRLQLYHNDSIIMHSDGLCSIRNTLKINPKHSAERVAKHISQHYRAQQDDDICCLVLHYRAGVKTC